MFIWGLIVESFSNIAVLVAKKSGLPFFDN